MAGLHGHHDHGGTDAFGSDGRFPQTVICDQCNAADGRAKRLLGLPATFSFSPEEIRRFVTAKAHEKHTLDLAMALQVYEKFVASG